LHHCLSGQVFAGLSKEAVENGTFNPFAAGNALREPIFYSGGPLTTSNTLTWPRGNMLPMRLRLLASQELTILGYHLKKNLWVDPEIGLMHLADDFSAGLDLALALR
jgi:hypothetical protein